MSPVAPAAQQLASNLSQSLKVTMTRALYARRLQFIQERWVEHQLKSSRRHEATPTSSTASLSPAMNNA